MTWLDLLFGNCYVDLPPECYQGDAVCTCQGFPLILPILVLGSFIGICFRVDRCYNEVAEDYFLASQKNQKVNI